MKRIVQFWGTRHQVAELFERPSCQLRTKAMFLQLVSLYTAQVNRLDEH